MSRNGSMTAALGMPTDPFANLHICQVQTQTNQYNQLHMTGTTLMVKELLFLTKAGDRTLTVTYLLLSQSCFLGFPGREAKKASLILLPGVNSGEFEHSCQKQYHENRQLPHHAFHQVFICSSRLPKTCYLQSRLLSTVKWQSS